MNRFDPRCYFASSWQLSRAERQWLGKMYFRSYGSRVR